MEDARQLGFLVTKHPDRVHEKSLPFGQAFVFFPEATSDRATMALYVEVDPVGLVRKAKGAASFALQPYVNDRPYVSSSFLSVALSRMLGSALKGDCRDKPELATTPIPLETHIPVLPCRGGVGLLEQLFAPLGYEMEVVPHTLPEGGKSPYVSLTLRIEALLSEHLSHLYVLMPVLDDDKHYWVAEAEVEKLLQRGEGWLVDHPAQELIVRRYLKYRRELANEALATLMQEQDAGAPRPASGDDPEEALEAPIKLHGLRLDAVVDMLLQKGCQSVLDLGCGEGKLIQRLMKHKQFSKIVGVDISLQSLHRALEKLRLEQMPESQRERVSLKQGALSYRDPSLEGFDGAAVVEVIEHMEPYALAAFSRILFEFSRPAHVVITTPNAEYNALFSSLPAGSFRHTDHRFEWTREEFTKWAEALAETHGYEVSFAPLGPLDEACGAPSQMGVFTRC